MKSTDCSDGGKPYTLGIAKRDITPPVGIKLCGFAARTEASTGVYHPLQATAVVIDDGDTQVLIIGADILGFYDRAEMTREALSAALPIPAHQIILAGSHTHCGPHIREFDASRLGPVDREYLALFIARISEAAVSAWESRTPGRLRFGIGRCGVAVSRRRLQPDGTAAWGPYPAGPHDHDVPVLCLCEPEGQPYGIVYSYACHPTSRAGLLIGGDYVSFTHDRVESAMSGGSACFLQGCGADQKPRPVDPERTSFDLREVDEVRRLGDELGGAVVSVVESGNMAEVSGPISVHSRTIELTTIAPDAADARAVLAGPDVRLHPWARRIIEAVETGTELDRHAPFEIQTLTFGNSLAVVTLAGEITVEHGLRLKRELGSYFAGVLPVGYANHLAGYVPVRRQIPEGGYCVEWANKFHGRTGRWADDTEDQIHAAVRDMLGL